MTFDDEKFCNVCTGSFLTNSSPKSVREAKVKVKNDGKRCRVNIIKIHFPIWWLCALSGTKRISSTITEFDLRFERLIFARILLLFMPEASKNNFTPIFLSCHPPCYFSHHPPSKLFNDIFLTHRHVHTQQWGSQNEKQDKSVEAEYLGLEVVS